MKNKNVLMKSFSTRFRMIVFLVFSNAVHVMAQTITLESISNSAVTGTICPKIPTIYSINAPAGCVPNWVSTNGTLNNSNGQLTASITWSDTPGATASLSVTFSGCTNPSDNSTAVTPWTALILSVKNQAFGAANNPVTLDYCNTKTVNITVPHMWVQGTGGIAQPPLQEVVYAWTLPPGWVADGNVYNTSINGITIHPTACAVPGTVQVNGVINDRCGSAGPSAPLTISLIGAQPFVNITVPQGYAGSTACNTTPITFGAALSPSLGCVNSYTWIYPAGWTLVSQTGNTITLRPSGSPADSDPNHPIKVTVNFVCGTSITGSYTPPFIAPAIIGPEPFCNSGTYTIANGSNISVTWFSSNVNALNINANSGFATRVNGYNGTVIINATVNPNSCPSASGIVIAPKTINVGAPPASISTLLYMGTRGVNPVTTSPGASYTLQCDQVPNATTYTWNLPSGFSALSGTTTTIGNSIGITTSITSGTYQIYCAVNNSCGSSYTNSLTVNNGVSGGNGCPPGYNPPCKPGPAPYSVSAFSAYPNPVIDELTVVSDIDESLNEKAHIVIINEAQLAVFADDTYTNNKTIDISRLPSGTYYLRIQTKDKNMVERIIKNK